VTNSFLLGDQLVSKAQEEKEKAAAEQAEQEEARPCVATSDER
jgi:hypothetical protein